MNIFDIMGPVMIGPSSSHTAGAARIGKIALALLGASAVKADIFLYGSFAKTYQGHGTDKALIGGIMGMEADDPSIRMAPELAGKKGMDVRITADEMDAVHPNTARVILTDKKGSRISLLGSSIGGGNVIVTEVNGMEVFFTGQYMTLIILHQDTPGTIAAVTEVIAEAGANICNFRFSRRRKGGEAVMTIETDGSFSKQLNESIRVLPNVYSSTMLAPI